eukprot:3721124-Amphidinium_carterae.1
MMAEVVGLPSWADKDSICWRCNVTEDRPTLNGNPHQPPPKTTPKREREKGNEYPITRYQYIVFVAALGSWDV